MMIVIILDACLCSPCGYGKCIATNDGRYRCQCYAQFTVQMLCQYNCTNIYCSLLYLMNVIFYIDCLSESNQAIDQV